MFWIWGLYHICLWRWCTITSTSHCNIVLTVLPDWVHYTTGAKTTVQSRLYTGGFLCDRVFHGSELGNESKPVCWQGQQPRGVCLFCALVVTPSLREHCSSAVSPQLDRVEPRCSLCAPIIPGCPLPLALAAICLSLLTSKQHKHSPSSRADTRRNGFAGCTCWALHCKIIFVPAP